MSPEQARPQGLSDLDALAGLFRALDHPARRHILQVLYARGGTLTAGELAARFEHSWPTTSRHLRTLEDAGLISVAVAGRQRQISIEVKHLRIFLDLWSSSVGLAVVDAG